MKNLYDAFFTLGAACQATCLLRDLELRDKAYPFDWLYNLECKDEIILERIGLIEKMLKFPDPITLLGTSSNLKHIKAITQLNDANNLHHSYWNTSNNLVFSHDFVVSKQIPEEQVFDQVYDAIYNKYRKRCNRLLELLCNKSKKVLAVWVGRPTDKLINREILHQAHTKLEMISNANIDLLVLQHRDDFIGYDLDKPKDGLIICIADYSKYSVYDANEISRIKASAAFGFALSKIN